MKILNTIRIFIADDHAIVREGLRALLATEPSLELVGEANDGLQAVSKVNALKPDVILLDMVMPHMDGLEAIVEIKKDWPEAKIIVLTSFSDDEKVFSAICNGALGYLLKELSPLRICCKPFTAWRAAKASSRRVLRQR